MEKTIQISGTLLVLLLIISFHSCIKEELDPDECEPASFRVYYTYANPRSYADIYEEAEFLYLFVFDENGYLVNTPIEDDDPRVGDETYYMQLDLEPGTYRFVTWGNPIEHYYITPEKLISGVTHYDNLTIHLVRAENDSVLHDPHHLYFGDFTDKVITGVGQERVDISLKRNTYRINVYIDDPYNIVPDDIRFDLVITDNNGSYGFDNSIADCDDLHYKATFINHALYRFQTSLNIVRLAYDRNTLFKLYDSVTGRLFYEDDLIDMIISAEVDLDGDYEFDIILRIIGGYIYVLVNGWNVSKDDNHIIFN
ncbi:MAG: FimB/Mfa2 family fimbrial subunit [Bacteroides sp.]|nr:FimB/Mfa2 family fimbrial subunit [Bacteroides sp.]